MADVKLVKSIYTGADVTSLGEVAAADTAALPGNASIAGLTASMPVFTDANKVLISQALTKAYTFNIGSPAVGSGGSFRIPVACTVIRVDAHTEGAGTNETCDFNLEERAAATPNTAGTNVLTTDLQAVHTAASVTSSFNNAGLAAGCWVHLDISAVANTPTRLVVTLTVTEP